MSTALDELLVDMAKEHLHAAHLIKRAHERIDELEKRIEQLESKILVSP